MTHGFLTKSSHARTVWVKLSDETVTYLRMRRAYGRAVTIAYDDVLRDQIRARLARHERRAVTDPTRRPADVAVVLVESEVGEDRVDPAPLDDWLDGRPLPDERLDGHMVDVAGGAVLAAASTAPSKPTSR